MTKEIIEMPISYADRVIRNILKNKEVKRNNLLKDYPFLAKSEVWNDIFFIVATFKDEEANNIIQNEPP